MYYIAIVILSALAFIGGLPKVRKWYGPVSGITSYFLSALYSLYFIFVYIEVGINNQISQPLGAMIAYLIFVCLNILYYRKRRKLFYGPTPAPTSSKPQIVNTNPNTLFPPAGPVCSVQSSNHFSHLDNHPSEHSENENSVDLLARIMTEQEKENQAKKFAESSAERHEKSKFKVPMFLFATLSGVLSISLVVVCVLWWNSNQTFLQKIETIEQNYAAEYESLERLFDVRGELLEDERRENSSITAERNFYRYNACIVTESGKKYHTYDCPNLSNMSTYWIFNTEYAEYLGYEPCLNCWQPLIENRLEEARQEAQEQDKQSGLSDHNAGR